MILLAIREKVRLEVRYRSLSNPHAEERLIAPHTLVLAGDRWHVRAFCERSKRFKDFMLHRFADIPECSNERLPIADPSHDHAWHRKVDMQLIPNPALTEAQQQLVADDYAMDSSRTLHICVRAALVKYMAVALRVDIPEYAQTNPAAHQLVLANRAELADLLL